MTGITDKNLNQGYDWSFPVPIAYGPGRLGELGRLSGQMGVSNPLIVTDRGSAGLPFIEGLQRILNEVDIQSQVFADVAPNPLDSDIKVARQIFREGAHDGDCHWWRQRDGCGQGHGANGSQRRGHLAI